MSLFKWSKIEVWCDFPGCYNSINFEGNELKFMDWFHLKKWKAVRGFYFCQDHSTNYIQHIEEIKKRRAE